MIVILLMMTVVSQQQLVKAFTFTVLKTEIMKSYSHEWMEITLTVESYKQSIDLSTAYVLYYYMIFDQTNTVPIQNFRTLSRFSL